MSNKTYDILKRIVTIVLPALAGFYVTLAGVWGLPYPTEIAKTIAAVVTLLCAVLGFSDSMYNSKKEEDENAEYLEQ